MIGHFNEYCLEGNFVIGRADHGATVGSVLGKRSDRDHGWSFQCRFLAVG